MRWKGEWVRVEHYLQERWGVRVTHTISDEAMQRMEEEIAASERAEDGEPLQPSGWRRAAGQGPGQGVRAEGRHRDPLAVDWIE